MMMETETYDKIIGMLKAATNIAVFMHINPDCDCIGSAIALSVFMRNAGKKAAFFSPDLTTTDMIAEKYGFLPHFSDFNQSDDMNFDLSVAVDTGDAGRVGDVAWKLFSKSKQKIVIDHHEIHEDFAPVTLRESDSASTTQILYKLMVRYNKTYIDSDVASLLYAGLVTDSGGFSFQNCTQETLFTASELLSYGINANRIYDILMKNTSKKVFDLKNRVLSAAKFYEDGKIGVIFFHKTDFDETGTNECDSDGIINAIRDVNGVEIAISLAEVGDKKFKVSFRTKDYVNAAICAKCFGGGGHVRAAGCRVYGYAEDVYEKVLAVATERLYD